MALFYFVYSTKTGQEAYIDHTKWSPQMTVTNDLQLVQQQRNKTEPCALATAIVRAGAIVFIQFFCLREKGTYDREWCFGFWVHMLSLFEMHHWHILKCYFF
jgi:hypothetical protein